MNDFYYSNERVAVEQRIDDDAQQSSSCHQSDANTKTNITKNTQITKNKSCEKLKKGCKSEEPNQKIIEHHLSDTFIDDSSLLLSSSHHVNKTNKSHFVTTDGCVNKINSNMKQEDCTTTTSNLIKFNDDDNGCYNNSLRCRNRTEGNVSGNESNQISFMYLILMFRKMINWLNIGSF